MKIKNIRSKRLSPPRILSSIYILYINSVLKARVDSDALSVILLNCSLRDVDNYIYKRVAPALKTWGYEDEGLELLFKKSAHLCFMHSEYLRKPSGCDCHP